MSFNFTAILVFLSFLVFMTLMKAVFFNPMMRIKKEREDKMAADRAKAQAALADLDHHQQTYEEHLRQARRQAQEIVLQLQQEAKKNSSHTVSQARQDARDHVDAKLNELTQWREETYQQLAGERQALTRIILGKVTGSTVSTASK